LEEEGMSAPRVIFLATEDWFVASHFLPLIRRAQREGYDVAVAARMSGALEGKTNARLIDMAFVRGSFGVSQLWRESRGVRALMRSERPDLVHAIALRPIALSLMAGAAGRRVFAVTGRGYLAARHGLLRDFALHQIARAIRSAVAERGDALLVENAADRAWVQGVAALPEDRVALMPGAGIDPGGFRAPPEPPPPIVVGIAARLVWSKGIDLAVEAVRRLRAEGAAIELRIAGGPDPENPERVADEDIARWRATPGVAVLGRVADINAFWAAAHVACLPSRGGEGLPRALLEAAACGRPAIAADVPGCADFVAPGETGLLVQPNDASALARAMQQLAGDAALRAKMGAAARERVHSAYTEARAADIAARMWRRLLER
jgi:glycosyltransferase involved in cell wall biosynthesis